MYAYRALAMIEMIVNGFEQLILDEVAKMIKEYQKYGDEISIFKSEEEFYFMLNNNKLIIELDDDIIKHFKDNKKEFDNLRNMALTELTQVKIEPCITTTLLERHEQRYKKVLIDCIYFGDHELGGQAISFLIGGIVDNTVGYLYVKDKKEMDGICIKQHKI